MLETACGQTDDGLVRQPVMMGVLCASTMLLAEYQPSVCCMAICCSSTADKHLHQLASDLYAYCQRPACKYTVSKTIKVCLVVQIRRGLAAVCCMQTVSLRPSYKCTAFLLGSRVVDFLCILGGPPVPCEAWALATKA